MKQNCTIPGCKKRFSTQFCLTRHIRCCHRLERSYECKYCFRTFGYKHVLLHHTTKKHPQTAQATLPVAPVVPAAIAIPRLTDMLAYSEDPDLGVYVHINRIYLFPVADEDIDLPPVGQSTPLPGLTDRCELPKLKCARRSRRKKVCPRIVSDDPVEYASLWHALYAGVR